MASCRKSSCPISVLLFWETENKLAWKHPFCVHEEVHLCYSHLHESLWLWERDLCFKDWRTFLSVWNRRLVEGFKTVWGTHCPGPSGSLWLCPAIGGARICDNSLTVGLPFPRWMLPFPENSLFQKELLQLQPVQVYLVEALSWSCSWVTAFQDKPGIS